MKRESSSETTEENKKQKKGTKSLEKGDVKEVVTNTVCYFRSPFFQHEKNRQMA